MFFGGPLTQQFWAIARVDPGKMGRFYPMLMWGCISRPTMPHLGDWIFIYPVSWGNWGILMWACELRLQRWHRSAQHRHGCCQRTGKSVLRKTASIHLLGSLWRVLIKTQRFNHFCFWPSGPPISTKISTQPNAGRLSRASFVVSRLKSNCTRPGLTWLWYSRLVDMPWFMMCYGCYGIWLVIWFYYVEEFGMYISLGQRRSHEVSVLAWLERKSELPGSKLPSKGLHGLKGRKFKSYTIHPWVGLHGYIRMTFWYVLVLSWHLSPYLAVCFAVIATKFTIWLQVFLGMPGCRHCFFAQQISR